MIARSVVVLPAPLRPSSVTTSPRRMSKPMPCSTWLSPYQPSSPSTTRLRSAAPSATAPRCAPSSRTGSDIGLDHPRVLRDGGVVALRQDLAARQHGDPVQERGDHREIVLDHQDGAVLGDPADQL